MRAKTESVPKSKVDIRNKFYEKMKNAIAQVSDEMVPLSVQFRRSHETVARGICLDENQSLIYRSYMT